MPDNEPIVFRPIQLRRFIVGLAAFWTLAVGITLTWEIWDEVNHAKEVAKAVGLAILDKELAFDRWNVEEGGVYVPVSDEVQPDVTMPNSADRDAATSSGRKLTLVRPSLMMAALEKTTEADSRLKAHFAKVAASGPDVVPDAWEKQGLAAFQSGAKEVSSLDSVHGQRCLRVMRPIISTPNGASTSALPPHKPGELLGGISVSVPMDSVWPMERDEVVRRVVGYGGMWILGVVGILFTSRQLQGQVRRRQTAEDRLMAAQLVLEQRVAERTQQLAQKNDELKKEISERVQTEKWLIESETRFRGYFELGVVGMVILSPNKQWEEVNPQFCKMLHYTESELLKKSWFDVTHPDDRAAEEKHFDRLIEGTQSGYSLEKRFLANNGQTISAKVSMRCLRQANGVIDSIIGLVHQIDAIR